MTVPTSFWRLIAFCMHIAIVTGLNRSATSAKCIYIAFLCTHHQYNFWDRALCKHWQGLLLIRLNLKLWIIDVKLGCPLILWTGAAVTCSRVKCTSPFKTWLDCLQLQGFCYLIVSDALICPTVYTHYHTTLNSDLMILYSILGAGGPVMRDTITRVTQAFAEGSEEGSIQRALQKSLLVSADMAHAHHPNYADKHEPDHKPQLHKGLVLKHNVNQRYATDSVTATLFRYDFSTVQPLLRCF